MKELLKKVSATIGFTLLVTSPIIFPMLFFIFGMSTDADGTGAGGELSGSFYFTMYLLVYFIAIILITSIITKLIINKSIGFKLISCTVLLFLPFILQKFSFTEMYGFLFIPIGVILLITFAVYNKLDTWKKPFIWFLIIFPYIIFALMLLGSLSLSI
ncbi:MULTISPECIES: hypothetical protein [Bacillaceae]|uniref:Uncharacterized protein n=1 Tax=Gottfriedia luciferensis TaxID=178774 RepID=A0ABX2ZV91_9BACI|nr:MULTISPECIES: hypothetical protein [Bacillaceae]ODG93602.1 hypothetical protein BED47_00060 [Gottfriedia luciferensis]PGZ91035.1 hypothetical protein COE53_15520 [Bacillus sp. AFS029533]SFC22641.1 hypothetical protein SAMN02799633_00139 [Bacillus sp. UNCCL81]